MDVRREGRNVVITMTAKEADQLENELLWSTRDDDGAMNAVWEALNEISGETE